MKINLFTVILLLFLSLFYAKRSYSEVFLSPPRQITDTLKKISVIKKKFTDINAKISFYKRIERPITGLSAEGGILTSFFEHKDHVKDHLILYGEMGKTEIDIYYSKDILFFIYKVDTTYDKPIYNSGFKVKNVSQNRFYFEQNKLFRWIAPNHKIVSVYAEKFKNEEKSLKELLKQLNE